jgi:hypothetical protein
LDRFKSLGIIKNSIDYDNEKIDNFVRTIGLMRENIQWTKNDILDLFHKMIPGFGHKETGKYLDSKM